MRFWPFDRAKSVGSWPTKRIPLLLIYTIRSWSDCPHKATCPRMISQVHDYLAVVRCHLCDRLLQISHVRSTQSTHVKMRALIQRTPDSTSHAHKQKEHCPTRRNLKGIDRYIRWKPLKGCVARMGLVRPNILTCAH